MILVDTSIWVDHLRRGNPVLQQQLVGGAVLTHPFVLGEIACGHLRARSEVLGLLRALPHPPMSSPTRRYSTSSSGTV